MTVVLRQLLASLFIMTLVACSSSSDDEASTSSSSGSSSSGGSSSSSSSSSSSGAAVQTGIFVDSAVAGIGYRTEPGGYEGITSSEGEYQYEEGDTVIFFIGDLELPPVSARGIVTPLNIANTDDVNNQVVVNIARLLQSLDQDGDPSNGITIPAGAATAAAAVDFNVSVEDFAASSAVTNLVANSGSVTTALISEVDATAHLQTSVDEQRRSLIGSWYYRDDSNPDPDQQYHIVLTFTDETNFVIANDESEPGDENGQDGLERGTYSWNLRTGVVEVEIDTDTNGEWGFSHPCDENEVFTLEVRGNELLVGAEGGVGESCDEAGGETTHIVFQRVTSETDPMIGSWTFYNDNDVEFFVITFMEGDGYMIAEVGEADEAGMTGIERGTYEIVDSETGHILFTTLTDTNGQWGLSHSCAVLDVVGTNNLACGPEGRDIVETVTVEGDILTFISEADTIANEGEEDPVALDRVRPLVEELVE